MAFKFLRELLFLASKFFSVPVLTRPGTRTFCKYLTHPDPKSKTTTRQALSAMPSWHSRQEALELGMRLRILWEPHISTQTTLLLLPAHPCSPTRAEEGRGEWPELKYGAPRKSTTSCPALLSQPCLVSSLRNPQPHAQPLCLNHV